MHKLGPVLCGIAILATVVATPALALGGGAWVVAATAQSMPIGKHIIPAKARCFARYVCSKGWIFRHFICGAKPSITKTARRC